MYHDAFGQVVEDGCFKFKVLPSDDGVGQRELEEEGLEDSELFTRSQAETLRRQTEGLRLPSGDGVWDSEGHILRSGLSGPTHAKRHTDTR